MKNMWKVFKREEKRKAHIHTHIQNVTNVSKSSSSETSACCFCFPLLVADIVYIRDFDMKS